MKQMYRISILVLAGLQLIRTVVKADLTVAVFIAAVIVLLSGLTSMGKGFKKITIVFLVLGVSVLIAFHQPLEIWESATNSMTNVIAIMVVMQMFTIPIEVGSYNRTIKYWLNKSFKKESGLFLFTTLVTHVFTSFLMLGTIPIMISLMEDTLKTQVTHYERFISSATSRGYALASLWAPGAVNLFLVVQATGISWSKVFVPGLVLGLMGIYLSYLLETRMSLSNQPIKVRPKNSLGDKLLPNQEKQVRNKAWHILIVVISLSILTMFLAQMKLGASSSTVILAGAFVVLVWTLQFRREPELMPILKNYWNNGVLKAADIAPFFIAVGLFTQALQQSGITRVIEAALQGYANNLGSLAIVLVPLIMIILAILGIHPFVSIVMFGQILMSLHLSVSSLTLALCLALGGSISYMVSPFAGIIMTIAQFINAKAEDIALRWNWVFCTAYFAVGILFNYYWGKIFG